MNNIIQTIKEKKIDQSNKRKNEENSKRKFSENSIRKKEETTKEYWRVICIN